MVKGLPTGGSVQVDMTGNPDVPASVLTGLKDNQGSLNINFGDYSCTINGSDIHSMPEGLASLDLSVSMEHDAALSEAAGGNDVYQLHFSYHGELPGKITYHFKASNSKPGDTVYLYYYYTEAGVIEGVQSTVVDASGYVSFDIYHCSSYFVSDKVINGAVNNFAAKDSGVQRKPEPLEAGIPLIPFFACLAGVAILSILGTILIYRAKLRASQRRH